MQLSLWFKFGILLEIDMPTYLQHVSMHPSKKNKNVSMHIYSGLFMWPAISLSLVYVHNANFNEWSWENRWTPPS